MKYSELNAWQKKRMLTTFFVYVFVCLAMLLFFTVNLYGEKAHARDSWDSYLTDSPEQMAVAAAESANAVNVECGTYVENIREINLKSSYYRVEFQVWFEWQGDAELDMANHFRVYKGLINKMTVMKDTHKDGRNYQLVSVDATVSKNFDAKRFPLESHQMRFYVESTYPIQEVVLKADKESSGLNRSLTIAGYEFLRYGIGEVSYIYDSTHGDPDLSEHVMTSEIITAMEINRSGLGLYFKCFVALLGTVTWSFIALFLNSYHHVDPLGMLPGALFGTVGNIMVGASLLPDALETGLLEYVNLWGIITILGISIVIINVNRLRTKYNDSAFAHLYGRAMFYTSLVLAVFGNILMPFVAYIR